MRTRMTAITALITVFAAACGGGSDAADTGDRDVFIATTFAVAPAEAEARGAGGSANPNDEPYDLVFFENYGVNPRIDTVDDPLSTFAVDVDTGSYTIARRWIGDGNLPDPDSVRVEEYVNFFATGIAAPEEGTFAVHVDGGSPSRG
jgi:Ca-activated chloride channel family protein